MTSVGDYYVPAPGEVLFPDLATDDELEAAFPGFKAVKAIQTSNDAILAQIEALEATQTPRRIREAVAGTDGGWLAKLESQIVVLPSQLQK